jgi:DNA-binding GntR family transcriptional regulator
VAELNRSDAAELYACRLLLEPQCARGSVEAMDGQRAATLTGIFTEMRAAVAADDPSSYVASLKQYNWTILDGCPNRLLFGFAESSWRASLRYWDLTVRSSQNYLRKSLRRNRGMQDAVLARDGEAAAEVATAVLELGRDELLKVLGRLAGR